MRALVAAAVVAGCYAPHLQTGSPCATGPCPSGLVCSPATSTCELSAEPLPADARLADALSIDGRAVDAPADAFVPTTPVLLQDVVNHNDTGPTVSATLSQMPVAGHVLVMVGANPSGPLTSVTGAATWSRAVASTVNVNIEVWYGVADGSGDTIAITRQGADAPNTIWVGEWSGLTTPPILDGEVATSGLASPADATSVTTPGARDLVIFGVGDGSPNTFGTPTPGAWAAASPLMSSNINQDVWYAVSNASATIDPRVGETSHNWEAALVAFRIAP